MWPNYILFQYISSFCRFPLYHIVFSPFVLAGVFRLWRWNMKFLDTEMKELGRTPSIILTTQDCWSVPSSMSQTSLQTEEAFMVKEYKHTHTHTGTNTHTYSYILHLESTHVLFAVARSELWKILLFYWKKWCFFQVFWLPFVFLVSVFVGAY